MNQKNLPKQLFLALCKLPLLHSQWFSNFRFSEIICYVIVVVNASFECMQSVSISILCFFLWHRQKTINYHQLRDFQDEQDGRPKYRLGSGLAHGFVIATLSAILSVVVGICSSQKFLDAKSSTSPLSSFNSSTKFFSCNVYHHNQGRIL